MSCPICQKEFYGEIYTGFVYCPYCGEELIKFTDKPQILGEPWIDPRPTLKEAMDGMKYLGEVIRKRDEAFKNEV